MTRKFDIDDLTPEQVLEVKKTWDVLIALNESEREFMENHKEIVDALKDLKDKAHGAMCIDHAKEIQNLKISYTEMKGDVTHIKDRLDNGISPTLTKISDKLNEFLPSVKDNSYWVGKFKWGIVWIAIFAVAGGLVSFLLQK